METVRIGFWMRLAAALIDGIVCAVLAWVPTWALGKINPALGAVVRTGPDELFHSHGGGTVPRGAGRGVARHR